jgi:S-adenosylmethionine hydrolase
VITEISKWYDDVPKGEALLMVNHAGFLEIAMNGSNAHKMLAIKEGDQVRITFNP